MHLAFPLGRNYFNCAKKEETVSHTIPIDIREILPE